MFNNRLDWFVRLKSSLFILLLISSIFSGCIMNSENKLIDTDGDGLADEDDLDDDGDGWTDLDEIKCASLGYDASSVPIDTDNDGICDFMDQDNDGDGVLDAIDLFPYNSNESVDFDNDGMGNVGDLDDDDDGWRWR